jgi:hypothetical protein
MAKLFSYHILMIIIILILIIISVLSVIFYMKQQETDVEFCEAIYTLYLETIIKAEKTPGISQDLHGETEKLVDYYRKKDMLPTNECHTDLEFIKKMELLTPRLFKSLNVSVPTQIL